MGAQSLWQSPEVLKNFLFEKGDVLLVDPLLGVLISEKGQDEITQDALKFIKEHIESFIFGNSLATDSFEANKKTLQTQVVKIRKILSKLQSVSISARVRKINEDRGFVVLLKDLQQKLVLVDIQVKHNGGKFMFAELQNIRYSMKVPETASEQAYVQETEGWIPNGN